MEIKTNHIIFFTNTTKILRRWPQFITIITKKFIQIGLSFMKFTHACSCKGPFTLALYWSK